MAHQHGLRFQFKSTGHNRSIVGTDFLLREQLALWN